MNRNDSQSIARRWN